MLNGKANQAAIYPEGKLLEEYVPATGEGYEPVPGDVIVWWRVRSRGWMGHAGIVHHVENGVLYTIEGNRVPKVHGFDYFLSRMEKLLGYGHAEG